VSVHVVDEKRVISTNGNVNFRSIFVIAIKADKEKRGSDKKSSSCEQFRKVLQVKVSTINSSIIVSTLSGKRVNAELQNESVV
jgi:hypothetical protein